MIKIQAIYKNIWDLDEFETHFTEEIIPKVLDTPGVIKMDYTSLYHSSNKQPEGLNDIHVITETYFESLDIMKETLASEEGMEVMDMISALVDDGTEVTSFIAQEKEIYPTIKVEKTTEMVTIIDPDVLQNPQH